MEEHFFFENSGYKLFGVLHRPDMVNSSDNIDDHKELPGTGFVLCSPFGEEKFWSHRVFVNFARFLCKKECVAMRFDYMGSGDSEGDFEEATVSTCISDISKAVSVLRDKTGVKKIGLLGLRLGATFAAHAAKRANADFMILWDPIIDGNTYFQECLRSNLTTQFVLYHKIVRTREQLINDLIDGMSVNIDGYLVSTAFYREISKLNLLKNPGSVGLPVLVVEIKGKQMAKSRQECELLFKVYSEHNQGSALKTVIEKPFWKELKNYFERSQWLLTETASWIDEITGKDNQSLQR